MKRYRELSQKISKQFSLRPLLTWVLLVFVIALSSPNKAYAKEYVLISDFDDTLKISHVSKKLALFWNSLFRNRSYTAMAELYDYMIRRDDLAVERELVILSNSPKFLKRKVRNFMNKHDLTPSEVILRNLKKNKNKNAYKMNSVLRVSDTYNKPLILIGDNVDHDHSIYAEFAKNHPSKVLAIYIHQVEKGVKLPNNVFSYHLAYDIAVNEYNDGRLSFDSVLQVGEFINERIETEKGFNKTIPKWMDCDIKFPFRIYNKHFNSSGENYLKRLERDEITALAIQLYEKISYSCKKRKDKLQRLKEKRKNNLRFSLSW